MEESIIQSAVLEPFKLLEWLKEEDSSSLESFRWKLPLSLPEVESESSGCPFLEMLKRKFGKSCASSEDSDLLVCQTVPGLLCPCVSGRLARLTSWRGSWCRKKGGGTSGVMFVFLDGEETEE